MTRPIITSTDPKCTHRPGTICRNCGGYNAPTERPLMSWYPILAGLGMTLIAVIVVGAVLLLAFSDRADARPAQIQPVRAPAELLRARAACPLNQPLKCRSALRRAYAATAWQRVENLKLARQMLGRLTDWTCIHRREGAWNDAGDPYWGGLQMDKPFMRTYGRDMIRRHHGRWADAWTPREQIIVAQRAYAQRRGYKPWPNTARACGLL